MTCGFANAPNARENAERMRLAKCEFTFLHCDNAPRQRTYRSVMGQARNLRDRSVKKHCTLGQEVVKRTRFPEFIGA